MIDMAKICKAQGIPEVVICTRFPNDPRRHGKMTKKSAVLRKHLLEAYKAGRFPSGVRVVDLYSHFADANGTLKDKYVRKKSKDYIHPRGAYKEALRYMMSSKGGAAVA